MATITKLPGSLRSHLVGSRSRDKSLWRVCLHPVEELGTTYNLRQYANRAQKINLFMFLTDGRLLPMLLPSTRSDCTNYDECSFRNKCSNTNFYHDHRTELRPREERPSQRENYNKSRKHAPKKTSGIPTSSNWMRLTYQFFATGNLQTMTSIPRGYGGWVNENLKHEIIDGVKGML